jgi:hypothetical protein
MNKKKSKNSFFDKRILTNKKIKKNKIGSNLKKERKEVGKSLANHRNKYELENITIISTKSPSPPLPSPPLIYPKT